MNDSADPQHYFRLLLLRLLETRKCLSAIPPSIVWPELMVQRMINDSTLLEIESWLKEAGTDWQIIPSQSSARLRVISGPESSTQDLTTTGSSPWDCLKKPSPTAEAPLTPSQAPLQQGIAQGERETQTFFRTAGKIVFRPNCSPAKPE